MVQQKGRNGSVCYSALREQILRSELRPGVVLDEAGLVEHLNVSRTPVREAIIQLIADGLVVREGRSVRVAPLDVDQIPPLYDALLISSRMVHRLAAEFRTAQELEHIGATMRLFEEATASPSGVTLTEANFEFHRAISASAHNRYFSEFYDRVFTETLRFARACFTEQFFARENVAAHLAETARQHRAIFKTIADRDVEAADRLAVEHYQLTRSRLNEVLTSGANALNDTPVLALNS